MKIALAQLNPTIGDFEANYKKAYSAIQEAKSNSCKLIIFTELFLSGYPLLDLIFKQGFVKKQNQLIDKLSAQTDENFAIIIGAIGSSHLHSKRFTNSAFCLANGKIEKIISKTLLPSYDVFDETRYFIANKDHDCTWKWQGNKIGLSICEDAWIEEYPSLYNKNPIENLVALDADFIINISASPFTLGKIERRHKLISRISKKYNTKFVYLNQVGANDQLVFDGSSFVCNQLGERILTLASFKEEIAFFDSSKSLNDSSANQEINTTKNIYDACVLGIKDYIRKTGFEKVVLGLSGGIDSAVVACLAKDALGEKNVTGIMMPTIFTSELSLVDAKKLAENLKINYEIKEISLVYKEIKALFAKGLEGLADENIQPRIRANVLMAYSNSNSAILLATGNKSEIAVGYSTLYGDSCGAIAAIGDLLKTQVYELAHYINRDEEIIPSSIITKAPSAELRHDQKDSDSLPDYEILDRIIFHYIDELKSSQEIIDLGFDQEITKKVLNMIDRAEYKRMQMPPIIKIANKAFGIGRRMPIAQRYSHA
jgi:NAD+ synthase (glutamine-hydrolysing)